jgi:hypothetical protein
MKLQSKRNKLRNKSHGERINNEKQLTELKKQPHDTTESCPLTATDNSINKQIVLVQLKMDFINAAPLIGDSFRSLLAFPFIYSRAQ